MSTTPCVIQQPVGASGQTGRLVQGLAPSAIAAAETPDHALGLAPEICAVITATWKQRRKRLKQRPVRVWTALLAMVTSTAKSRIPLRDFQDVQEGRKTLVRPNIAINMATLVPKEAP